MTARDRVAALAAVALGGIVVAVEMPGLATDGQLALAVAAVVAVLWVTGALPLPVTALLVPVLLTLLGVTPDLGAALAGFADPIVFLMLGSFVLAAALSKHGVDRRVALRILFRFGTTPRRLVLGVMAATALVSMVVSNTATAAMMVPVAIGLVDEVTGRSAGSAATQAADTPATPPPDVDALTAATMESVDELPSVGGEEEEGRGVGVGEGSKAAPPASNLRLATLLGIAYAASVGGVGTLVGTPPNAIVVAQLDELLGVRITYVEWLAVGLPMVAVTLPLVWYVLVYRVYPPEVEDVSAARARARERLGALPPLSAAGRRAVVVFVAVVSLWLLGGLGFLFEGVLSPAVHATLFGGEGSLLGPGAHGGVLDFVLVGVAAVPALFAAGAVDWDDVAGIDWGTLLLFGGGISLAEALSAAGTTAWLADHMVAALAGIPLLLVLAVVVGFAILLGELASNTAMAAVLVPLLVGAGPAYALAFGGSAEFAAVALALTGALATSYGFALPVATPPNAIVFGSGSVTRDQLLRAGWRLDLLVGAAATLAIYVLSRSVWPLVV